MNEPLRRVVVVGDGSVAWIAAAGLARAFRARPLEIQVVEAESRGPSAVGWWTLPSQRGIHGLLAINEPHFLQHTGATFRLATEHRGWQGEGSSFLHAHGDIGIDYEGTPFYKYLQREAASGRSATPDAFSVAGTASRAGKFARPMGKDLTASFTYGFHVGEAAYARYLRDHALRLGVGISAAPLAEVTLTPEGDIDALRLADGTSVAADLFLDCSGSAARLLSRIATGEREDWSRWLPCDRMISGRAAGAIEAAPVTRTQAAQAGWMWQAPLAKGVMAGHVYASALVDESEARAGLHRFQPGLDEDLEVIPLRAGRQREFWIRNCVALGAAAMDLEPLAGAQLHFAQVGLANLVELFPLHRSSRVESREFNRVMTEQADALRDFTIAHYRVGEARSGEFWTSARRVPLPTALADRLDLYASNGRLVMRDHETFEETDWAWLFLGSGFVPAAMEVQTRDLLDRLSSRDVESIRARVGQLVNSMPTHAEFLRHQLATPARPG